MKAWIYAYHYGKCLPIFPFYVNDLPNFDSSLSCLIIFNLNNDQDISSRYFNVNYFLKHLYLYGERYFHVWGCRLFFLLLGSTKSMPSQDKPSKSSWKHEDKIWSRIESLEAYAIDACINDEQRSN
jgi:hypothetical protein